MNTIRIAMWSGPRNISTAMMRAWENRGDTAVWDEPLYAHYLDTTGIDHPMKQAIISAGETDWQKVVDLMLGPIPGNKAIFFQKHMTHHLLDHIDRNWMTKVAHCFLIRNPSEVLASYAKKRREVDLADIGIEQQAEIFNYVAGLSQQRPPVIDARDVLMAPAVVLSKLCERTGAPFTDKMLSWPAGPRVSDGVWGAHWYESVQTSTGFDNYEPKTIELNDNLTRLAEQAEPFYQLMYAHRIRP